MSETPFRIKAFGAQAVVLEWPREISMEILQQILGFTAYLKNKRTISSAGLNAIDIVLFTNSNIIYSSFSC